MELPVLGSTERTSPAARRRLAQALLLSPTTRRRDQTCFWRGAGPQRESRYRDNAGAGGSPRRTLGLRPRRKRCASLREHARAVASLGRWRCCLSVEGLVCQARRRRVGGEWLRVVERGSSCARAPRLISVLDHRGVGDMMVMGCCSRWGKRCGRSVFRGRPPVGVGSNMPGAGRDVSV
jgi:hypothetical protein